MGEGRMVMSLQNIAVSYTQFTENITFCRPGGNEQAVVVLALH